MKTKTVIVREGEYLGPIDWNHDFAQYFQCHGTPAKSCAAAAEKLRQLTDGRKWRATTDGGWPRCGWGDVLQVGMYDGWPYWRPFPAVYITSHMGGDWHTFSSVTSIELAEKGTR